MLAVPTVRDFEGSRSGLGASRPDQVLLGGTEVRRRRQCAAQSTRGRHIGVATIGHRLAMPASKHSWTVRQARSTSRGASVIERETPILSIPIRLASRAPRCSVDREGLCRISAVPAACAGTVGSQRRSLRLSPRDSERHVFRGPAAPLAWAIVSGAAPDRYRASIRCATSRTSRDPSAARSRSAVTKDSTGLLELAISDQHCGHATGGVRIRSHPRLGPPHCFSRDCPCLRVLTAHYQRLHQV